MRKLAINAFVTLDGVVQGPGGPEEDPTGGFRYGGWSAPFWDDVLSGIMSEVLSPPFDLLLGRRTYEIFAAHWPYLNDPVADALNQARKYVASSTLDHLEWNNSTLLTGDVPAQVAGLKQQDGPDIQVHGSADLIQTLQRHSLVDVWRIWTCPIVVGPGKRLFGDGTVPARFALTGHEVSTTGVIVATYETAGDVEVGSFALAEPSERELERRRRLE